MELTQSTFSGKDLSVEASGFCFYKDRLEKPLSLMAVFYLDEKPQPQKTAFLAANKNICNRYWVFGMSGILLYKKDAFSYHLAYKKRLSVMPNTEHISVPLSRCQGYQDHKMTSSLLWIN